MNAPIVNRPLSAALISSDAAFRDGIRTTLKSAGREISVAAEIAAPFSEVSADHLKSLRQANPGLVFLDLEHDPALGIRLAQFLSEAHPGWRFIAVGPTLAPELLISAMQAGISEYLPKPVTVETLVPALQRLERKMGRGGEGADERQPGQLLAVFSTKGGSGTTTVAANLAIQLHQLTGKKTLLVDLDLELGEIALFLGMQPRFNFVDMIRNFHRMDAELLASYIEAHESGVHLLSAPFQPERAEAAGGDQIRQILQFLKQHYDYVVVDTSKSFAPPTLATFEQADQIFLVTNVDLPSLRNIKRCLPLMERASGGLREKLRLVVNRYHPKNDISLEEAERSLNLQVFWKLANDYESVIGSINSGTPVITNANSAFANDIRELGAEVTGLRPSPNGKSGPLGSLRRLFRSNGNKQPERTTNV